MKKDESPIDEKKLMEMMAQPFSKNRELPEIEETNPKGKQREQQTKSRSKDKQTASSKKGQGKFQGLFLKKNDLTARSGKTISIRPEYHERLLRITQVIGENKISLSIYLDNILEYHFIEFEAEIKKLFKDKYKPIL